MEQVNLLVYKMGNIKDIVTKIGKDLSTNLKRKAMKPMNQYKALERAHKVVDDHITEPVRAPMNVPKVKFTKEQMKAIDEVVAKKLSKNKQVLEHMQHVKVVSLDNDSNELNDKVDKSKFPQKHVHGISKLQTEIPRGRVSLRNTVDILYNNNKNEEEFNSEFIADKFRLREDDVKQLLKNFALLKPNEMIKSNR